MSAMLLLGGMGSLLLVLSLKSSVLKLIITMNTMCLILWLYAGSYDYTFFGKTHLFFLDEYSLVAGGLMLALLCAYSGWFDSDREEVFVLWSFVGLGALVMVLGSHWLVVYLGMELQSMSLFAMVCYPGYLMSSVEAGIKYFVLSAMSSGLFLFGCVGVLIHSGSLYMGPSTQLIGSGGAWFYSFILCGLLFKLAAVPFHFWMPDVYQGSSPKVVFLLSSVPKISTLIVVGGLPFVGPWLMLCSGLSMVVGSMSAVNQSSLLSLLSYSGMAHVGFVLWPISYSSDEGVVTSLTYLLVYFPSLFVVLGVSIALGLNNLTMAKLAGVMSSNPPVAGAMLIGVLSLGGVPPLSGFLGKWLVIQQGIYNGSNFLVFVSVVASVIAVSYYLSMLKLTYFQEGGEVQSWGDALTNTCSLTLNQSLFVSLNVYACLLMMVNPFPMLAILCWPYV